MLLRPLGNRNPQWTPEPVCCRWAPNLPRAAHMWTSLLRTPQGQVPGAGLQQGASRASKGPRGYPDSASILGNPRRHGFPLPARFLPRHTPSPQGGDSAGRRSRPPAGLLVRERARVPILVGGAEVCPLHPPHNQPPPWQPPVYCRRLQRPGGGIEHLRNCSHCLGRGGTLPRRLRQL